VDLELTPVRMPVGQEPGVGADGELPGPHRPLRAVDPPGVVGHGVQGAAIEVHPGPRDVEVAEPQERRVDVRDVLREVEGPAVARPAVGRGGGADVGGVAGEHVVERPRPERLVLGHGHVEPRTAPSAAPGLSRLGEEVLGPPHGPHLGAQALPAMDARRADQQEVPAALAAEADGQAAVLGGQLDLADRREGTERDDALRGADPQAAEPPVGGLLDGLGLAGDVLVVVGPDVGLGRQEQGGHGVAARRLIVHQHGEQVAAERVERGGEGQAERGPGQLGDEAPVEEPEALAVAAGRPGRVAGPEQASDGQPVVEAVGPAVPVVGVHQRGVALAGAGRAGEAVAHEPPGVEAGARAAAAEIEVQAVAHAQRPLVAHHVARLHGLVDGHGRLRLCLHATALLPPHYRHGPPPPQVAPRRADVSPRVAARSLERP